MLLDLPQIETPLIEFEDATVVLGGTKALDSVNFSENVAIIGPNGSGKSTIIRTITRECYPLASEDGPSVKIMGEHIWNVFDLRSMLGIVSGNLQKVCDRDISGREIVLSGFFSSIGLFSCHKVTEQMETKTKNILQFLEIEHLADKMMNAMSTGEARRILIGRALVHNPMALMLDEPTNGLDPRAAHKFNGMLRRITRSGKSIIMVTHHLQDIIPEITRIIMVKDGKVFKDGSKEDILTKNNLSELFSMPAEIEERNGYYQLWLD